MKPSDFQGRTNLLVLQATPFCNINCSYCYLSNRDDKRRMSIETAIAAVKWIIDQKLASPEFTIVWHSGEPLVMPPDWYREVFAAVQDAAGQEHIVTHAVQTNGILINDAWCDLFKEANVRVGVSIDGPRDLHDRNRKTRRGGGTHEAVMRGVETLKRRNIPFHAIAVVGESTARSADAFVAFMDQLGALEIGINFEELEGGNSQTSLNRHTISPAMKGFLRQMVDHAADRPGFNLRELHGTMAALHDANFGRRERNSENDPFSIVTIDASGGLFTFSPELAGQTSESYKNFRLGSVFEDSLADMLIREPFVSLAQDIAKGVGECRRTCPYFAFCMGGAPSNKIAELGCMTGTETTACRHSVKAFSEAILTRLEIDLVVH